MAVTSFIGRNAGWSILHPKLAYQEHKLMRIHLANNMRCAACGEDRKKFLEVHHVWPLWFWGEQAGKNPAGRYITLCDSGSRSCHLFWGHAGHYGKYYVENVVELCAAIRVVVGERRRVEREMVRDDSGTPA